MKRKEEAYPWKAGASSGHITNLKQSILETFDIYVNYRRKKSFEVLARLFETVKPSSKFTEPTFTLKV
jgi:hypothetical protein